MLSLSATRGRGNGTRAPAAQITEKDKEVAFKRRVSFWSKKEKGDVERKGG